MGCIFFLDDLIGFVDMFLNGVAADDSLVHLWMDMFLNGVGDVCGHSLDER